MAYNYEDFVSAATKAGMMDKFDAADLETARKNPEFGLSLLSLMQDSANATTDEQRLLAAEAANQLRQTYGSFSAGTADTTETAGTVAGQTDGSGSFVYDMEEQRKKLLDAVINQQPFSYDAENDPRWSSYKKAYLREGDRATQQTLAQASAASGGRPSSYAVGAAQQAGNYYAGQLSDIIPTLYEDARSEYLSDINAKLNALGALNTDREIDYAAWLDQYNMDKAKEQEELAKKEAAAELMASAGDYTLLGELLGLTPEQIAKLNGQTSTGGGGDYYRPAEETSNAFGVAGSAIEALAGALGVSASAVYNMISNGYFQSDIEEANSEALRRDDGDADSDLNKAIAGFKYAPSSRLTMEQQIENYVNDLARTNPDLAAEVGAELIVRHGYARL